MDADAASTPHLHGACRAEGTTCEPARAASRAEPDHAGVGSASTMTALRAKPGASATVDVVSGGHPPARRLTLGKG